MGSLYHPRPFRVGSNVWRRRGGGAVNLIKAATPTGGCPPVLSPMARWCGNKLPGRCLPCRWATSDARESNLGTPQVYSKVQRRQRRSTKVAACKLKKLTELSAPAGVPRIAVWLEIECNNRICSVHCRAHAAKVTTWSIAHVNGTGTTRCAECMAMAAQHTLLRPRVCCRVVCCTHPKRMWGGEI